MKRATESMTEVPAGVPGSLIDSLVLSQLRYCVEVYGNGSSENLDLIQKVLNFAARIISNRQKYDHITDDFCINSSGSTRVSSLNISTYACCIAWYLPGSLISWPHNLNSTGTYANAAHASPTKFIWLVHEQTTRNGHSYTRRVR